MGRKYEVNIRHQKNHYLSDSSTGKRSLIWTINNCLPAAVNPWITLVNNIADNHYFRWHLIKSIEIAHFWRLFAVFWLFSVFRLFFSEQLLVSLFSVFWLFSGLNRSPWQPFWGMRVKKLPRQNPNLETFSGVWRSKSCLGILHGPILATFLVVIMHANLHNAGQKVA